MPERTDKHHKDMSSRSLEWVMPAGVQPLNEVDLETSGSILLSNGLPIYFVRGSFWRAEEGDPKVRENDVKEIYFISTKPDFPKINTGSELELFAWDPEKKDVFPIMDHNSLVLKDLNEFKNNGNGHAKYTADIDFWSEDTAHLGFSDELMRQQIEINFKHGNNDLQRAFSQLMVLRKVSEISEVNGAKILPISNFPHRKFVEDDVNSNPYVRRIALKHMGWQRVEKFTGSSYQTHVECFDSEVSLKSINYLQQITPIMLALSTAGPFINGKVYPDSSDMKGISSKSKYHSLRFLGRKYGSPSGGVIEHPAPEKMTEFINFANERLMSGDVPTVSRALGHHTDFRLRIDIKPGTIEFATMDNFGAHPLKLAAINTFNKALTMKIQYYLYNNREDELPSELFGKLDQDMLEVIDSDSIAVSQEGIIATIHNPSGNEISAGEQLEKLIEWVKEPIEEMNYSGIPEGVTNEIVKSAMVLPEETPGYDPETERFLSGFYETCVGTLSQWLHRRAESLLNSGLPEKETVIKCMGELAEVYGVYIRGDNIERQITNMYSSKQ